MLFKFRLLALVSFLWIAPAKLFAQTKPSSETIGVDLGSGTFTGTKGLPFDVPFIIQGDVTPNLKQITLTYTVKEGEVRRWMQFPKDSEKKKGSKATMPPSSEIIWRQTDDYKADQKFHLQVGPIHPNVTYQFNFKLIRTIDITTEQHTALKKKLLDVLYQYVDKIETVDVNEQQKANDKLNLLLKQAVTPGAEILELDQTPFELDLAGSVLQPIVSGMIHQNRIINNFDRNITPTCNQFNNAAYSKIKATLQQFDETNLDAASLALYNGSVDLSLEQFKDVKLPDITKLLLDPATDLCGIFKGNTKLEGNKIIPSDGFDASSVTLLNTYFKKLKDIKTKADEPVFKDDLAELGNLMLTLNRVITRQNELTTAETDRAAALATFPNVLADKLISLSFVFFDQSNMDVVSEANPYVGLDFGTAFIPSYNQFFIYEGVNFYFAPVNKDAPLSRFSGNWRNLLSKMISIHIGLTQNLVKVENERYVPLIANVGSLLIGAGIRVNRIVRINAGSMFFFQKDANPLIDRKTLTSKFTTSLTIDLNVAKALGNIGKRLNLNQ